MILVFLNPMMPDMDNAKYFFMCVYIYKGGGGLCLDYTILLEKLFLLLFLEEAFPIFGPSTLGQMLEKTLFWNIPTFS